MSEPADHTTEAVDAGLDDARATIAEIWRNTLDDGHRKRAMRALQGVIAAEQTMRAADAFLVAKTRNQRADAYEQLRISCYLRVGANARKKP